MKFEPSFLRASVPQLLYCDGYMLFAFGQIQIYTITTKILNLVFQFNLETGYGASNRPKPILCGYKYQYLNLVFLLIPNACIYFHNAIAQGSEVVANIIFRIRSVYRNRKWFLFDHHFQWPVSVLKNTKRFENGSQVQTHL